MYMKTQTAVIDNFTIQIEDEKNLLELIRKANIELPTFCYHSEISVYGACRMCMVEIEGRGIVPACSTKPEGGMVVHTNTAQIRKMRKMIIELMLASHDQSCTTCPKSGDCKLQNIAKQLGVDKIRFKQMKTHQELDLSSDAIIRDPVSVFFAVIAYVSTMRTVRRRSGFRLSRRGGQSGHPVQ